MKRVIYLIITVLISISLVACSSGGGGAVKGSGDAPDAKFTYAYQYGLQMLPAKIVEEQGLIQKHYPGNVDVEFLITGTGAEINEGIIAGNIDAGIVGMSIAVTGVTKGAPYKVFSGVSNIPSRMISNTESLKTLADVTTSDRIALVSLGSIGHILLSMAAKKQLGDAHALDNNIMGMSHPDGLQALISGSVQAHMTTFPYFMIEENTPGMHEVPNIVEDGIPGVSTTVNIINNKTQENNPQLAEAVIKAFAEAMSYINDEKNHDAIAESLYESEGVTKEEMLAYLKHPDVRFDTTVTGLMTLARFMDDEGFVEGDAPTDPAAYFLANVGYKD